MVLRSEDVPGRRGRKSVLTVDEEGVWWHHGPPGGGKNGHANYIAEAGGHQRWKVRAIQRPETRDLQSWRKEEVDGRHKGEVVILDHRPNVAQCRCGFSVLGSIADLPWEVVC